MIRFATYALSLSWLWLASFMIVLSPPVTHLLATEYVDSNTSQLSHEYLVQIADDTRSYTVGLGVDLPQGTDERTSFSPQVMQHLNDVRDVFIAAEIAAIAVTLLLVICIVISVKLKKARKLAYGLISGSSSSLALVIIAAVLGYIGFEALFSAIHSVFFAQGSWLFSYDSLLICALPLPFWIGAGIVWLVTLLVFSLGLLVAGLIIRSRARRRV